MIQFNKMCDAADWFDPEIDRVITEELREVPRFHRKQWEFAAIFLALRKHGLLNASSIGLSMGGGKELLLYAIARHVRQLIVTDLYDTVTTWDCARTDDPDAFIKSDVPLPVDVSRLKALRMDMRALSFDDGAFDFCYSSCSIEHIGEREDFLQHLREVYRVLKVGGMYAFTTEVHYGREVIMDPANYVFSLQYLADLIREAGFEVPAEFNAGVAHHRVNFPLPANIRNLSYLGDDHIAAPVFRELPHVQLLRGKFPYTSGLFILNKPAAAPRRRTMRVTGLDISAEVLSLGIADHRTNLRSCRLTLHPLSSVPPGVMRFYTDHAGFFRERPLDASNDPTIFHTDYFWFGTGFRTFTIQLDVTAIGHGEPCMIELRVHRYPTLSSTDVSCVAEQRWALRSPGIVTREVTVRVDDEYCYAVLAHHVQGDCAFGSVKITSVAHALPEDTNSEADSIPTTNNIPWTLHPDASPGFMPSVS